MIARLLSIRAGEERTVYRLAAHFLLTLAATTFHTTSAEGLFLGVYPSSLLPYVYLGGALLGSFGGFAYDGIRRRLGGAGLAILLAAILVGLRFAIGLRAGPFLYLLFAPAFGIVLGVESANLIQRALDPRAARRLFPAIGAIAATGPVTAGLLVGAFSRKLGAQEMIWPAIACLLLSILFLDRGGTARVSKPRDASRAGLFRNRFAVLLVAIAFIMGLLTTLTRYTLGVTLKSNLSADRIASYLGLLNAGLSAAGVLFQLLLARPVIGRLGVGSSLAVYPGALLTAGAFVAFLPGLAAATAALSSERLLRQNLLRPILQLAVMPLPDAIRARTITLVRGMLEPLAIGAASVALLAIGGAKVSWAIPVLGGIALVAALAARESYSKEVTSALHARRFRLVDDAGIPADLEAGVRRLLHDQIGSDLPVRAALALQLLEGRADAEAVQRIRGQWRRWDSWVKVEAIRALAREPIPEAVEFLRSLPHDEPAPVRMELLRSGILDASPEELDRLSETPDVDVRREALARIAQRGGLERVRPVIDEWAAKPQFHAAAAYVIGFTEDEDLRGRLPHLAATAPAEAIRAAARKPAPWLAEVCVRALDDDRAFAPARETLLSLGDAGRAALEVARSAAAIRVLGEIRSPALLALLSDPDEEIRYRAAKALAIHGLASNAERKKVEEVLESEIARIGTVASEDFDWAAERLFVLLSLLFPGRPFRRIYLSYISADARQKGFALEALEELLSGEWRRRIVPILEGHSGRTAVSAPPGSQARKLKETSLFREWKLRDLDALLGFPASKGPWIVFEGGEPVELERTILGAARPEPVDGQLAVPLAAVYQFIEQRRRCGPAWLRGLALRTGRGSQETIEVTRSFQSLGSRTLAEEPIRAEDVSIWQRLFFLREVPLFQGLSPERLRLIAEIARPISADTDDVVVREGRPGHHFYVVCSGFVEVGVGGRQVAVLGEGDAFGERALLTGEPRSATVRAMKRSELLSIERTDFLDLLETHPSLVSAFSILLAKRAF